MDCPARVTSSLYIRGACSAPVDLGAARHFPYANRHTSEYQHSRRKHHLELHRVQLTGYERSHRVDHRANANHDRRATSSTFESQSLNGIAVVKVFFQPSANIERAIAQVTAISQTQLRQLPQGTTPPLVISYSASSVPILQLALSGQGLSEQQLNDFGLNFIRTRLITVPGASVPYPYGGKQREVQVDLDTNALQARGLSPSDVVNAISAQNLILPAGTSKIGSKRV